MGGCNDGTGFIDVLRHVAYVVVAGEVERIRSSRRQGARPRRPPLGGTANLGAAKATEEMKTRKQHRQQETAYWSRLADRCDKW